jgi:3-hydroxyisobutyrate dehydrogenase-like beta-hydroxyacid dehydrogenase
MSGTARDIARAPATVGVLYAGEMGAALAALLRGRGVPVVTTLRGRGDQTARRCAEAGITVLESAADVVRRSDFVVSLVPPAAAEAVCADYCRLAAEAPPRAVYVDMNSVGPDLAATLATRVEGAGRSFVDGAINGLAKNLASGCTLYLSGPRAEDVARLVGNAMRVRGLGERAGDASAMKMLLSALSKGLCALFAETALVARRRGMLDEMIEAYRMIYPGAMAVVDRMLPTYTEHAARRASETRELEETARSAGVEPCVLAAVRRLHEVLAEVPFRGSHDPGAQDVPSFIDRLAREAVLAAPAACPAEPVPEEAVPTTSKRRQ